MRLLKDNTHRYEPFFTSLQFTSRSGDEEKPVLPPLESQTDSQAGSLLEKYHHMVQNIIAMEKQISTSETIQEVSRTLKLALKRLVPLKNANFFLFDETKSNLFPFDNDEDQEFVSMVNNVYKEGILDWVFESGKPTVVPEVNNYTVAGPKLNYLFFPVIEDRQCRGILAVLTTLSKENFNELESHTIQIILSACIARMDKLFLREKLNKTYNELQTYQAKLSNDFRLSAIGELTEGIVEDIKSPLQVILSYADFLSREESDQKAANIVKEQVKKINFVINRLVKFSSLNEEKVKVYPCDLNTIISEYYNLVKSSLENANIECLLDFENDIPSVISHPSYIYQLLSNVISIIKANSTKGGGIIIQTRYYSESIVVKVINTAQITSYSSKSREALMQSPNLNFKIIDNIMRTHEGTFSIESFQKNSSVIQMKFPLRRRKIQ
ncbi:MAG TPA: histidine kinase dimerization/phospho-acceptor domain-containing protein [Ignavibacteriales bacterium]|nr:histidine kinase dimerization/phospho-acceptor domain-containing protein [Ignavibacteriales bacterium]